MAGVAALPGCSSLRSGVEAQQPESVTDTPPARSTATQSQQPEHTIEKETFEPSSLTYTVDLRVVVGSAESITAKVVENEFDVRSKSKTTKQVSFTSSRSKRLPGLAQGDVIKFAYYLGSSGEMETPAGTYVVGSRSGSMDEQPRFSGLSHSSFPSTESVTTISRTYEYPGGRLQVAIPEPVYAYSKSRPRRQAYGFYGDDPYNNAVVRRIAAEFDKYDAPKNADRAIEFVQSLEYTPDDVTTSFDEYPRYPVETLVDEGGDCEDSAMLLASLFREMGYGTKAILLPADRPTHMAVGIAANEQIEGAYFEQDGTRYYYVESTGEGWSVGELPTDYRGASGELLDMSGHPVLNFKYTTPSTTTPGGVTAMYHLLNQGNAAAENVRLRVEFLDNGKRVVGGKQVRLESLGAGEQSVEPIMLVPPRAEVAVQIRTRFFLGNELHAEHSTSPLGS